MRVTLKIRTDTIMRQLAALSVLDHGLKLLPLIIDFSRYPGFLREKGSHKPVIRLILIFKR